MNKKLFLLATLAQLARLAISAERPHKARYTGVKLIIVLSFLTRLLPGTAHEQGVSLRLAFRARSLLPMKLPLLLGGLLASGSVLTGCGAPETQTSSNLQVSAREDTWLTIDQRWRGGFSGSGHDEYQVLYVRRGWLGLWDEQDTLVAGPQLVKPELRRVDTNTFEVITGDFDKRYRLGTYTFYGPWPAWRLGE